MPSKKRTYIRASEIGTYLYCRRAWWLRQVAGFEPQDKEAAFAEGEAAHLRHGELVQRTQQRRRAALFLLLCGLLLLVVAGLLITTH
jgi:CRISPR/Cas system-associated exonuclease Cas4 (RecB family)